MWLFCGYFLNYVFFPHNACYTSQFNISEKKLKEITTKINKPQESTRNE